MRGFLASLGMTTKNCFWSGARFVVWVGFLVWGGFLVWVGFWGLRSGGCGLLGACLGSFQRDWTERKGLRCGVGGFEVFAGLVGLGLIAGGGGGELVLGDGVVALVEEVEHFAGVELCAFAEPVGAVGLGGGG